MDYTLSLSGLRVGLFSQVILQQEIFDPSTQSFNTTQADIMTIFLQLVDILSQMDENSSFPLSAKAVFDWVTGQLSLYRPRAELIPMADIENLIQHLLSYRLELTVDLWARMQQ